jgi:maltose O-acetyltransferase
MSGLSEKEKMLAGELYLAADSELVTMRHRARMLTRHYNATTEEEETKRLDILMELFGRVGPSVKIEPPFFCDYGSNINAGDGLYMNFGCVVLDCAEVNIGTDLQCGPYVQIYTAYHPLNASERTAGPELASPITIGSRVWIGGGAIICPGITIGDDTTIGAGSIVTRDIPAGVLAAGNPCRVVRTLDGHL